MEDSERINSAPKTPQENVVPESISLALIRMQAKEYRAHFDRLGITLKDADFYMKAGLKADNIGSLELINRSFGLHLRVVDVSYSGQKKEYRDLAARNNAIAAILRWHLENVALPREAILLKSQILQKIVGLQERVDYILDEEKRKPGAYARKLIDDMRNLDLQLKDLSIKVSKETDSKRLDNYATILDYNEKFLSLFGFGEVKPKAKKVDAISFVKGRFSVDGEGRIGLTDSKGNIFNYTVVKPQEIIISATNSTNTGAVLVTDGITKGLMTQDVNGKWRTGGFDGKASIWDSYDVTFGYPIEIKKKFAPAALVVKEVPKPKKSPEDYHGVLQYGSAEWKEWAESAHRVSSPLFKGELMWGKDSNRNVNEDNLRNDAENLRKVLGKGLVILKIEGGDWCQACNRIKPFIEEAEKKYDGRIKFVQASVFFDADASVIPYLLEHDYGVKSFPTFLVFKDGKLQEKIEGVLGFGLDGTKDAVDLDKTRQLLRAKLDSL